MDTNREICIAEGLLLCTWFLIDVQTLNPERLNILTNALVVAFMVMTALFILSFLIRKDRSFVELVKALWKSHYFDAMVSISIALPWMGYVFETPSLNTILSYISWVLAGITLTLGLVAKRDRTIPLED